MVTHDPTRWLEAHLQRAGDCLIDRRSDARLPAQMKVETGCNTSYRLAWTLAYGPVPDGMEVRHTCGNWRCCSIEHLFLNDPATGKPRVGRDMQERFWEKVDTTGDCWLWTAGRNDGGYGVFGVTSDDIWLAHRLAWLLATGDDPGERAVLHRCDNPPCVRKTHLFLGSRGDNLRDMVAKGHAAWQNGRQWGGAKGEASRFAKLTDRDVQVIRYAAAHWGATGSALARLRGLDASTINLVIARKTWKHVPDLDP